MIWKFKDDHDIEYRKMESSILREKYPSRIPVIVQKAPGTSVPAIDKHKFLVPIDISVAQMMWIIRKRVQLQPEKAMFIFVGKVLPQSSATMSSMYVNHVDEDGFLYIMYSGESTFGAAEQR